MNTTLTALDSRQIRNAISGDLRGTIASLEVAAEIDSTNSELLRQQASPVGQGTVLLADRQTSGRGRRGRAWVAAPGETLCLSIGWTFARAPRDLGALSLVIGVCLAQTLETLGARGIQVKWPNDLVVGRRKLGGILIETVTEPADAIYVVAGVGVNLALGTAAREAIRASGAEPVDLSEITAATAVRDPSFVAAKIIESLLSAMQQFSISGLQPHIRGWNRLDGVRGQEIAVQHENSLTRGIARGIDISGALVVETPAGLLRFFSGEVTVRQIA